LLKDGRLIAVGGALAALGAGLLVAWVIMIRSHPAASAPPASQGGLVVVSGRDDDAKLDPKRPLRCFVGGQFVGELALAVCAQRNGVATGSLDVGLDPSGALAATNGAGAQITPLPSTEPPEAAPADANVAQTPEPAPAALAEAGSNDGGANACWRYAAGGWRQVQGVLTLPLCVQTLYAARCPGPDQVYYGRWGAQTLRLMGGRVEVSSNNRDFSPLADPWPPCIANSG